jgi:hypothetical protein
LATAAAGETSFSNEATRQKAEKWIRAKKNDAGEAEAIGLALQEQAE